MSGAPEFSGDGARFTAVDPGERMRTPGFTKQGNLQSPQSENRNTVKPAVARSGASSIAHQISLGSSPSAAIEQPSRDPFRPFRSFA